MRPRYYTKSTVSCVTPVEMDPHRQHLLEYIDGRLDEDLVFFLRPTRKPGVIDSLRDRDTEVLVKGH
jgi:hypothetical protein